MIDDETIKKIADAVKLARISDVWKNPKKAQAYGQMGWIVAIISVYAVLLLVAVVITEPDIFGTDSESQNIMLDNLSCNGLRNVWFELKNSDDVSNKKILDDIQDQIIVRCLE